MLQSTNLTQIAPVLLVFIVCVCVCLVLYSFTPCVDLCLSSVNIQNSFRNYYKETPHKAFWNHMTFLSALAPTPGSLYCVFQQYVNGSRPNDLLPLQF